MLSLPEFQAGQRVSASKLQTLSDTLGQLLNSRLANGSIGCYGLVTADLQPEGFWARVIDNDGKSPPAHSWVQVIETSATEYVQKGDGLTGDSGLADDEMSLPLYEINGKTLETDSIVFIWRGISEYYLTNCCADNSAWVTLYSPSATYTPQSIQLIRPLPDCQIDEGDTVLTCDTGNFTSADVGRELVTDNLPAGVTIQSIVSDSSCVLDQPATASLYDFDAVLLTKTISVYEAKQVSFNDSDGTWKQAETTCWFMSANASDVPAAGRIYQCRQIGEDQAGTPIWSSSFSSSAWLQATNQKTTSYLGGRRPLDMATATGSTILTSQSANFTSADVGKSIAGPGILDPTTVLSVQSATSCTLSAPVTEGTTNSFFYLGFTAKLGTYFGNLIQQDPQTGVISTTSTVRLFCLNDSVPVNDFYYRGWKLTVDADGIAVWTIALDQRPPVLLQLPEIIYETGSLLPTTITSQNISLSAWGCTYISGLSSSSPAPAWCLFPGATPTNPGELPASGATYLGLYYGDEDVTGTPIYRVSHHAPLYPIQMPASTPGYLLEAKNGLYLDASTITFGPPTPASPAAPNNGYISPGIKITNPSFTGLQINYGGIYTAATGTDGLGNIFISGLNVAVGGVPNGTGGGNGSFNPDFGREV